MTFATLAEFVKAITEPPSIDGARLAAAEDAVLELGVRHEHPPIAAVGGRRFELICELGSRFSAPCWACSEVLRIYCEVDA